MAVSAGFWAKLFCGKLPEYTLLILGAGLTVGLSTVGLRALAAEQSGKVLQHTTKAAASGSKSKEHSITGVEVTVPDGSFAGTYLAFGDRAEANKPSQVIGQLSIPALPMTAPIISGITDADLLRGAGHIPGSGNAGGLGNMVVAGHRDTYFRPLRRVQAGMLIHVSSANGNFHYKVDRTEIVTPEQLQILDIGNHPQLTLVTCYPFDYIGAAPKRFIVFAHLLSVEPDA